MINLINKSGSLYCARVEICGITGTVSKIVPGESVTILARGVEIDYNWKSFHEKARDLACK